MERGDAYKEEIVAIILKFDKLVEKVPEKKSGVSRKRGSTKLYVDFYYHGVRIVKSSGLDATPKNEKELQGWVDRQKEKITNGTFRFTEAFPGASAKEKAFYAQREGWEYKPEPQNVLFGDYAERWVQKILTKDPSKTKCRDHTQIIDYWLLPYFRNMTFYQITGVAIKKFISTLVWRSGKKKGEPLSVSRKRNILIPFRAIWDDACVENHWQLKLPDPFVYVKKKKCLPSRVKNPPEVFRFDEWMKLMANFDPFYRIDAETMLMTGMIGSEMAGLRKVEDIQGNWIQIQNSIVKNDEKDKLKTKFRKRKLPITQAIRKCLDVAISRSKGNYVFTMKSGRTFDNDSFRKNPWTSAFKKAGLPYKVPYAMRHSFAAWALTLRMDPNRLVDLMGHGSKEMVYDVYGKYVEDLEKDAGKILEYFGKDFLGLKENTTLPFTTDPSESHGESDKAVRCNSL